MRDALQAEQDDSARGAWKNCTMHARICLQPPQRLLPCSPQLTQRAMVISLAVCCALRATEFLLLRPRHCAVFGYTVSSAVWWKRNECAQECECRGHALQRRALHEVMALGKMDTLHASGAAACWDKTLRIEPRREMALRLHAPTQNHHNDDVVHDEHATFAAVGGPLYTKFTI